MAGRVNWSADYFNYEIMFDERHDWSWAMYILRTIDVKFEPAFFALIKYLPSYRWVMIVQSFFLIFSLYILFYRCIPVRTYPLAFVLWLFNTTFFESITAMRSTFVIVLFILAVIMKIEGRWKLAILLVILSGLFHNSGLFMLPLICIPSNFICKYFKFSLFVIILLLFVALVAPTVYSDYLNSIMEDSEAMDYSNYIQEVSYGLGYYFFTSIRIIIIVSLLSVLKKNILPEKYNYFIMITVAFYVMNSIPGIGLTYRINCYLRPFLIASLCCYYYYINKNSKSVLGTYSKFIVFVVVAEMLFNFLGFYSHPNYELYFVEYESAFF